MNEQRVEVDSSTYPFLAHAKPRPGQLEMIQDGILALAKGGFHLAAAPTGIGKTAASLAAALEVAGRSSQKKTVFFLTSRQTQHRIVVDTVRRINERRKGSMPVRLVDMVGQAGMCVHCQRVPAGVLSVVQSSQKNSFLQTLDHIRTWTEGTHPRHAPAR